MRKFHNLRSPLLLIVESLSTKSVRIPGTLARVVDFDIQSNQYKFVVEFKENKFKDFSFPMTDSFGSLTSAVKIFLELG